MKIYKRRWKRNLVVALCSILVCGCGNQGGGESEAPLFDQPKSEFGNIEGPKGFDWKQYDGMVLNFVCEDNISANILSKESEKFTKETGIKVNIKSMDFNSLEEKINIDFISKTSQYDVVYVDPYQTLNRFSDCLEDLNQFENNKELPHLVGGIEAFDQQQVDVCSYFRNKEHLYAIPFDSTTMILFYRQDIFDKYKSQMQQDLGYAPEPGAPTFTWEQYIEVSQWITEHVPDEEVKYGSVEMSAKHNSIYTVFSTMLDSNGGMYFEDNNVSSLGLDTAGELASDTKEFERSLRLYSELVALNPKEYKDATWSQVTNAFVSGEVAMMLNWDENTSAVENVESSKVANKVGYSILPFGDQKSSNIYGGSGIGINKYASTEKKLASWLFIVWATSPDVQMKVFQEENGGNLPTRIDLEKYISTNYKGNMLQIEATLKAQQEEHIYFRPKLKKGYEFETIIIGNLYDITTQDFQVDSSMIKIRSQWNEERRNNEIKK